MACHISFGGWLSFRQLTFSNYLLLLRVPIDLNLLRFMGEFYDTNLYIALLLYFKSNFL